MKRSIAILLIIMIIVTGCAKKEKQNISNTDKPTETVTHEIRTNPKVDNQVYNVEFSSNFLYENESSMFDVTIKNLGSEEITIHEIVLHIKDENNENIIDLIGYVNSAIPGQQETLIQCSYGGDLRNYKSVDYEILN